jgi:tRNA A-37 threonylcarbamoyl transferase component Bud32
VSETSASPLGIHRRRRPSGEPPPLPREYNRAAIGWLIAFVFWAAIWVSVFLSDRPAIWITEFDLDLMAPIVDNRVGWLDSVMSTINEIGTHWLVAIVGWVTLIGALIARRIRHGVLLIVTLALTAGAVNLVAAQIGRPRPLGMTRIGDWEGFAQPSRPVALLAAVMVACTLTLVPIPWRRHAHWTTGIVVALFGLAQVYTAVDHPSDVAAGASVGIAFTLVLYRTIAPEAVFPIVYGTGKTAHLDVSGVRGEAIRKGLRRQLAIEAVAIDPIGLAGSSGSTPLRVRSADGDVYFAKLYARSHLRSDRSYKLWRTLIYGRLEDEQHFTSVRRLVQQEDYMLHVMQRVGVASATPAGIVEITPDREYLLMAEFLDDAVEISEVEVTEDMIDQALGIIECLWRSGLAHRDIKPSNVMVQRGRVKLIDVAFAQIRPSPWRQAVDLANMMLVLGLQSSAEVVYERARLLFSEDELAEAFAASRGVTLPSQLRRAVRADGREMLDEFRALAPPRTPVSIQRWSFRRLALTAWVVLVAFFVGAMFVSSLGDIGLR